MKSLVVAVVALILWVLGCLLGGWLIHFFFSEVPFVLGVKISALISLVNTMFSFLGKLLSE